MNSVNNRKTFFLIAIMILAVILLAVFLMNQGNKPDVLSESELLDGIVKEDEDPNKIIGIIFVGDYEVSALYLKDEDKLQDFKDGKFKSATSVVTGRTSFIDRLHELDGDRIAYYDLNNPGQNAWNYIIPVLSVLMLGGFVIFLFVYMRGNKGANSTMNFGKTKARVATAVKVRFNDVAGAEEEKEELKEVVEFLKSPKKFRSVGARIPKGVLLVGSPGTGKTLFAKAVAGEASVPFFSISGSDFVEMFVGVGASRVRDLFAQAKKNQPCIVFIDEIDAVGRKRGAGLGGGNDEREQTLNQLLVQMDGFDENDGVVIMAATNRADVLDPALLRPGRFDRQVYVNMPDVKGREGIFRVHSRNKPLAPDVDFKNLARLTTGFSGADIENVLNEAAIFAARESRSVILMKDIQEGINKVIAGPQKRSRVVTEKDKRITAYHEAGHAIVGKLMKHCNAVQEISIIPRGMAAGYTISRPDTDDNHITKNQLNDDIAMRLGGRAAEEIVIHDISTGASQDLKQATGIARKMVTEWGMSDALPNLFFGGEQEVFIGRDYQTQASYSNEVASIIDKEIRKIIDNNYARALQALKEHEGIMHDTVRLLFEHETIYGDELDKLFEGATMEEVTAYIADKKQTQEKIAEERRREGGVFGNPEKIIVPEPQPSATEPKIR
ncbi:MAG: ATP-dependent zinc metalloprotease FtsH [Clostridia bacterium]